MRVCVFGEEPYLVIIGPLEQYKPIAPMRLVIPAKKVIIELTKNGDIFVQIIERKEGVD